MAEAVRQSTKSSSGLRTGTDGADRCLRQPLRRCREPCSAAWLPCCNPSFIQRNVSCPRRFPWALAARQTTVPAFEPSFGTVVRPHCQHPSGPPVGWNLVVPTTCKSRRGTEGHRPRRGRPEPTQGRPVLPRASAVQAGATRAAVDHAEDLPRVALAISYRAFHPWGVRWWCSSRRRHV